MSEQEKNGEQASTSVQETTASNQELQKVKTLLAESPLKQNPEVNLAVISSLIEAVVQGDLEQVESLMLALGAKEEQSVFRRARTVTKKLNNSFTEFKRALDQNELTMSSTTIPHAAQKLEHVLKLTADSAHRTMDFSESNEQAFVRCLEQVRSLEVLAENEQTDSKTLKMAIKGFITNQRKELRQAQQANLQIVLAQEAQDLTGQVIKKTIDLIRNIESNVSELLGFLGMEVDDDAPTTKNPPEDTSMDQSDADSMLKDLGF